MLDFFTAGRTSATLESTGLTQGQMRAREKNQLHGIGPAKLAEGSRQQWACFSSKIVIIWKKKTLLKTLDPQTYGLRTSKSNSSIWICKINQGYLPFASIFFSSFLSLIVAFSSVFVRSGLGVLWRTRFDTPSNMSFRESFARQKSINISTSEPAFGKDFPVSRNLLARAMQILSSWYPNSRATKTLVVDHSFHRWVRSLRVRRERFEAGEERSGEHRARTRSNWQPRRWEKAGVLPGRCTSTSAPQLTHFRRRREGEGAEAREKPAAAAVSDSFSPQGRSCCRREARDRRLTLGKAGAKRTKKSSREQSWRSPWCPKMTWAR